MDEMRFHWEMFAFESMFARRMEVPVLQTAKSSLKSPQYAAPFSPV
ncbi:hypothetical protein NEIFLAOT_02208 [Neisseria flavescens NRL30031/H210]|uniref:Uncharacterized protein n=1 Tax=Neisseria flavescens NRL30031/H210 TaxID=546264 RepID=C0EQF2_NEIFL|nr:hypothetical protein NEIFLAOT_02208 [Neisseria flavescens NRL30031/H210]